MNCTDTHTSGPWKASPNRDDIGAHFITNPMGVLVAKSQGANLSDDPYSHTPGRSDETDANARLIAAAPDLLDYLERIVEEARNSFATGSRFDRPALLAGAARIIARARDKGQA